MNKSSKIIFAVLSVLVVVVASGLAVSLNYNHYFRSAQKSQHSDSTIITSGTVLHVSSAGKWSIGQFFNFTVVTNGSILRGQWTSTQPTNMSVWIGYPNKSTFPGLNNNTQTVMEGVVNISLSGGNYAIIFQTLSTDDVISITENFSLVLPPNSS